jgi:pimeloyl-ACP methyl ester carboxylesterase
LATLKLEARSHNPTRLNVIFVHGLGSNPQESWKTTTVPPELWIKWLAYDLRDVSVWTVHYEAAKTRWSSESSMALTDRALNILEHILATKEFNGTEIALVGHSTGGLVVKQLMRTTNSLASSRADAAQFQAQVRRVVLIATPNLGTGQATFKDLFRILTRPSAAAEELVRNNPTLRDLNLWYREWVAKNEIAHLILVETRPTSRIWGIIAKPDTSDPGLPARPIPIDADHFSISRPISRSAEVYVLLKNFLSQTISAPHPDTVIKNTLERHSGSLDAILFGQSELAENVKTNHELLQKISEHTEKPTNPKLIALIDSQIDVRLTRLTKCRFFHEFDRVAEAQKLAEDVLRGELASGTPAIRSKTLAWCARLLADIEHVSQARSVLVSARSLADCKEIQVAESFLLRTEGQYKEALKALAGKHDPLFSSAMFMIAQQEHGFAQALEWAAKSQLEFTNLDGDGKFFWLTCLLNTEQWDDAQSLTTSVLEADFEQSPILLYTVALSNLLLAAPNELRRDLDGPVPFELDTFPLNDDRKSLLLRKAAAALFSRASDAAGNLACTEFAKIASDYHQWLLLRDAESKESGLLLLKKRLDSSDDPLRYVNFALKFGLKLDFEAVDREIDKQVAMTGGSSLDAAIARLALTLNQSNPASVLRYLAKYRAQLEGHIVPALLDSIEIQALVASGQVEQAEQLITELSGKGVSDTTLAKYRWFIESAVEDETGSEIRVRQYKESGKISDLAVLVEYLLQKKDWERLTRYAKDLFRLTNSITDAETFVIALENSGKLDELELFLNEKGELVEKSNLLMTSWSWALYRAGRLADASNVLGMLQSRRDDDRDRSLEVNIAIASGAWESLAEFVEKQWKNRDKRSAVELMRAARIAQAVSAPRAKDLMFAAIEAAPTNPEILMSGYMLATESGWESGGVVGSWLSTAAEHSSEEGPIRRVSLEEIVNSQPDWDRRVTDTSRQLVSGEMPIFLAAKTLNRTLVELVLANGIENIRQSDPRRRTVISAFSGARSLTAVSGGHVAMDATAILTIGRLGFLDKLKNTFSSVSIPHSTLPLFFEESRKIAFHQPSQLKRANFIRQLLSSGEIAIAPETAPANSDLIIEVGNELAALLGEVSMQPVEGRSRSFVVTSFPVHRAGSLREEEVDLTEYIPILCDAGSVLRKLADTGQIMHAEQVFAQDYLKMQGQVSCREVELPDGASLYFDDLTFTHLYHAGILKNLKNSGLKIFISAASIRHVDALIERERSAPEQLELINLIKTYLEDGIEKGEIRLSPAPRDSGNADYDLISHPSWSVMQNTEDKDCLLVDDRYFNHHLLFDNKEGGKVSIITSLDLLATWKASGVISNDQYCNAMTILRRASYIFVPIDLAELQGYFEHANVRSGLLLENAELKAIREYLLRIRMANALKIPQEGSWLESVLRTFMTAIKEQWLHDTTEDVAAARCDWLWGQIKALHWANVLPKDVFFENVMQQFKMQNMALASTLMGEASRAVREGYWRWLEREVIVELKDSYPEMYEEILVWCGKTVSEVVAKQDIVDGEDE